MFSKPPQFQPLLKYWGHLKKLYSDTTNCGVDGKNSPSTPQNVVSKVNFRRHPLQKFTFDTTFCGGEGEFLPSTPQFVVSEYNFFKGPQYFNRGENCRGLENKKLSGKLFGQLQLMLSLAQLSPSLFIT